MIHGAVAKLFPVDVEADLFPTLQSLSGSQGEQDQFLSDLVQTLCEEPAYHYGFREAPGHNVGDGDGGIAYTHRFANSCFLDVLRRLIDELGGQGVQTALLDRYARDSNNTVIIHNLGMLFGVDCIALKLHQADLFRKAWRNLDRRPDWDRPRPAKSRLEDRLRGLTLEERLERMWTDQDDAKQYMRYLGATLDGEALEDADYEALYALLSGPYRQRDEGKLRRIAKTIEQSDDIGFRGLGRRLLTAER